jgi:site-specific DNA-methyltransferase (adenine-specific)
MTIQIFNGDCLEVMKDLSANSIDCFICDLPYGCLRGGGGKEKKRRRFVGGIDTGTEIKQSEGVIAGCSWDIKLNLEEFWKQVKRLAKDEHTPVIMFCTTKFGFELYNSNPSWFRYDLVWDKQRGVSFLSANKMPMRSHEMIYVFSKAGAYYNRIDISGNYPGWAVKREGQITHCYAGVKKTNTSGGEGKRCVKSIVSMSGYETRKKNQHPTEKPIELYKWLIERYSPSNGTILDPTAGSFNSCAAAQELGRKSIGIEKDKGFYEKAEKRFRIANEIVDTENSVE